MSSEYIEGILFEISIDDNDGVALDNLIRKLMYFQNNIVRICELLQKCNYECSSYEKRHAVINGCIRQTPEVEKFSAYDAINNGIDFLFEIRKAAFAAKGVKRIKFNRNMLEKVRSIEISIFDVKYHARDMYKILHSCCYVDDKNCGTSEKKEEIDLFFKQVYVDFEGIKNTISQIFGSN